MEPLKEQLKKALAEQNAFKAKIYETFWPNYDDALTPEEEKLIDRALQEAVDLLGDLEAQPHEEPPAVHTQPAVNTQPALDPATDWTESTDWLQKLLDYII